MGVSSVKIPVELELKTLNSQIESLRGTLKGVKEGTAEYKKLDGILRSMEKQFLLLSTASQKAFSSQSEIARFEKVLENMGSEAKTFQDVLSQIDISKLNIDTSAYEEATKEVERLTARLEILQKGGNVVEFFDSQQLKKLKDLAGITSKDIPTFDTLFEGLNTAVKAAEQRIEELKNKIQSIDDINVGNVFDTVYENSKVLDKNSRVQAVKDLSVQFGVELNDNKETNAPDFINKQTEAIKEALEKRKKELNEKISELEGQKKELGNTLNKLLPNNGHTVSKKQLPALMELAGLDESDPILTMLGQSSQKWKDYFTQIKTTQINELTDQKNSLEVALANPDVYIRGEVEKTANNIKKIAEQSKAAQEAFFNALIKELSADGLDVEQFNVKSLVGDAKTQGLDKVKENIINSYQKQKNAASVELRRKEASLATLTTSRDTVSSSRPTQENIAETSQKLEAARQKQQAAEQAMLKAAEAARNAEKGVDGLGDATAAASDKAKKAADDLNTLSSTLNSFDKVKRIVTYWFSFQSIMRGITSTIKSAVSTIHELDDVMTEIAIVTDFTQEDLWGQMGKYSSIAQEYGTSIKGVYEVSQLFYQQGMYGGKMENACFF